MNKSLPVNAEIVSRHRTGLVWVLTAVGLSTVAIVLAASFWSLACIRSARVASDELRAEVSGIADRGNQIVEDFARDSLRLLNDPLSNEQFDLPLHPRPDTNSLLDKSKLIDERIAGTVADVALFIKKLRLLDESCHRVAIHKREVRKMREVSIRESESAILRLQTVMRSVDGARILKLARDFRAYKKLDGKAAQVAAQNFLETWPPQVMQSEVMRELNDLTLARQKLIAATNRDAVVDLRDNQIRPIFGRLRCILDSQFTAGPVAGLAGMIKHPTNLEAEEPETTDPHEPLRHLENAFWGVGFKHNRGRQTIVMGQGGLFQNCDDWLAIEAERELLKTQRAEYLETYGWLKQRLLQRSARITSHSALQATELVAKESNTIFLIGLLSAIVFLSLASRVAKTIATQLNTLAQQSVELATAKADADKLSLVAKHTANSVLITDSEFRIEWANDGFNRLTGYTPQDAIGLAPGHFLGPDTDPKTVNHMRAAIHDQKGFDVELINYRKDGSLYWTQIEVRPIRDVDDTVVNFIAIESDITWRKDAERERETLASELQAGARRAGMAELASDVLHNVGNALNSINVSAQTLRDQFESPTCDHLSKASQLICDQQDHLAEFLTKDQRGKQFPNFLRQLATSAVSDRQSQQKEVGELMEKIEHVKEIVACQKTFSLHRSLRAPVSPIAVVEQAIKMNAASLERHGVRLEQDFESGPDVLLDKHAIIQVLMNLIKNAKESVVAAESVDPHVTISIKRHPDEVVVSVSDNGMGIENGNLIGIFGHGFTTKATGQGFGLHSSANVAQELGGSLSASSGGERKGATFTLTVPSIEVASCIA